MRTCCILFGLYVVLLLSKSEGGSKSSMLSHSGCGPQRGARIRCTSWLPEAKQCMALSCLPLRMVMQVTHAACL